ncbi:MAG: hypothetical protein ABI665_04215 [Vicinamibacterales bacterium]
MLHSWPLATDPAHLSRLDNDDASLNAWVITWVPHALAHAPLRLFEAPIFYPEAHALAYSEHMLVPSLMGAPLIAAGASPVLVQNLLIMLGLALSGWAMFLLMSSWTGSVTAGLIAGLAYGFNAHVLTRFAHLQAQHVEFLPAVLYTLDRVLERGRRRDAVWLAAAIVLQSLCSNYLLVFTLFAVTACVATRPSAWLGAPRRRVLIALILAGAITAVALAPFLWPYYLVSRDQGMARGLDEVAANSATWSDYLSTGARLHYEWWSHRFGGATTLFPGATAAILAVIALGSRVRRANPRIRMALVIAVMGVALSFGPSLPGYAWLHAQIPLLAALRAASRWGWLALAAIAILAGYGVAAVEQRWPRARTGLAIALGVLVTAEAMRTPVGFTTFQGIPAIYDRLRLTGIVVAEFPIFSGRSVSGNGPYLVNNTRYLQPLVNGYSGFQPTSYAIRAAALRNFPEPGAIDELKKLGVTHLTVHTAAFAESSGVDALKAIDTVAGLELVADEGGIRLYRFR